MKIFKLNSLSLLFLLFLTSQVFAQDFSEFRLKGYDQKYFRIANDFNKPSDQGFSHKIRNYKFINNVTYFSPEILQKPKKKKSVALGVLLSAILPGAGEFYGESYLKAGIFLGVELLAWGTYIYFTGRGDKKDEEFRKFADQNWDVRRYARWLNDQFQQSINWQEPDLQELRRQIILAEQELRFSHTLPEYYTQQYYEVIGKYQTFMGGWADAC
ncbi:MAG: hypothetical protein N2510_07555, partial [Ignavibacteria bacterium]|nr:hypothetical protein [Ignavibacteria bacterium]